MPAQPEPPVTTWQADNGLPSDANESTVLIAWTAPDNGGSAITGYTVLIKQSDGDFSTDLANCDMASSTATSCVIPVAVLRETPFSIEWGSSVFAKVVATNQYGDSTESLEGNGAVIVTTPGAPTSLLEDTEQRTKSVLAIVWNAPVFTGGDAISEYRVSYAEQGQSSTVVSGITDLTITVSGLTAGV